MSDNRIEWHGLEELRAALRRLPDDLTREAGPIVLQHATAAHHDTEAVYAQHEHTGTLLRRLRLVLENGGRFGVAVRVISGAPHAWWFEHGTEARHTDDGALRGRAPAHPAFIPAMIRRRREMYRVLAAMLTRIGLQVSGDAER